MTNKHEKTAGAPLASGAARCAAVALWVVACGLMAACSGGYGFVAGDTLEIKQGGKTVKTLQDTEFWKVEGLDAYISFDAKQMEEGVAELYVAGSSNPVVIKDAMLGMVNAFMETRYVKKPNVVTATGHVNPNLSVFVKIDLKSGTAESYPGCMHTMNDSGDVLALMMPPGALGEDAETPSTVMVNNTELGSVPSTIYDITGTPEGFSAQADSAAFTVVKVNGAWTLKDVSGQGGI